MKFLIASLAVFAMVGCAELEEGWLVGNIAVDNAHVVGSLDSQEFNTPIALVEKFDNGFEYRVSFYTSDARIGEMVLLDTNGEGFEDPVFFTSGKHRFDNDPNNYPEPSESFVIAGGCIFEDGFAQPVYDSFPTATVVEVDSDGYNSFVRVVGAWQPNHSDSLDLHFTLSR